METIVHRAEAKALGLKRYYTGNPCKHGHVAERYIGGGCVECDLSGKRAAYVANPEIFKARALKTYRKNPSATIARNKRWVNENRERAKATIKSWNAANKQRVRDSKDFYLSRPGNRDAARAAVRAHYARNKPYYMARSAARRARKLQATPPWYGELDSFVWLEAAHLVQLRGATTGFEWHADHMVPLAAECVSGLHVHNNCQVIPALMNASKGNKLVFINHGEWIRHI